MDPVRLFEPGAPFFLIAGPCVLEDDDLNLRVGEEVARLGEVHSLPVIFKASYDKANRSSLRSPRGPGLEEGLRRLAIVKERLGLPLTTDVHQASQAAAAATVVDVLQIPAFLCRQTDLLLAAGATGLPVNLKKGQWMAPADMARQVEKAREAGAPGVAVTERGTAFGYRNLVVDMRSFGIVREQCRCPAVFDASHSVQLPGAAGEHSGGEPWHIPALARAAVAAGADGLFVEVHPNPVDAPSDGDIMLRLDLLSQLVESVLAIRKALQPAAGAPVDV